MKLVFRITDVEQQTHVDGGHIVKSADGAEPTVAPKKEIPKLAVRLIPVICPENKALWGELEPSGGLNLALIDPAKFTKKKGDLITVSVE